MKKFTHFFKAMWAAIIAYKRGVYFTTQDQEAFWQLSLHSKFFPGLMDFDLRDPENGSAHCKGNALTWEKVEDDGATYWKQRYIPNFDKDSVIRELCITRDLLAKERKIAMEELNAELHQLSENRKKEQDAVRTRDDVSFQNKACLL
jgi:hypothetical protein